MEEKYNKNVDVDNLIVEEILVLLQEKRTALRMVRIGIAAIIAQITILGFLIATSKYYEWMEVMHLWIPFVLLNLVVLGIAGYFIFGSLIHIHRLDRQVHRYKKSHSVIANFMD
jgi:hypothetical protein